MTTVPPRSVAPAAREPAATASPATSASAPRLGAAIRAALSDYYFHSMRLVPANVVWGAGLFVIVLVGFVWPPGGLLPLPLLALPTAGIFRLAARIVRVAPDPGWRDIFWPYRHAAASTLAIGAAIVGATVVLGTNVGAGAGQDQLGGWVFATFAGWGLVAVWSAALVVWPLVVDPARDARPIRDRLRTAGAVLLVDPLRVGGLAIAVAIITALSTILTAALLTISISFVALVACRVVYPAADRLEPASRGERS